MRALATARRRFARNQRGAAAIEFAIICLPLILLAVGVIELGRAFNIRSNMAYAADVGTRRMLVDSATPDTELKALVRDAFTGGPPDDLGIDLGTALVGERTVRTLRLTYPLSLSIPGISDSVITLDLERRLAQP
jgi:Flp pilus assembly pilin Flp